MTLEQVQFPVSTMNGAPGNSSDSGAAREQRGRPAERSTGGPIIRDATDLDWEHIYPFFSTIVAASETYAYPEHLSLEDARAYWIAKPPGRTVVAVDRDRIVGSATMGANRPGRGSHIATASFHGRSRSIRSRSRSRARPALHRLGAHLWIPGDPVQRGRRDQSCRRAFMAEPWVRDPGHRSGSLSPREARLRRAARDVPAPDRPVASAPSG